VKLTNTRKGFSSHGGGSGKLKKLLEGSTIVDLLTLGTLALNFQLLKSTGTGYGSNSILQIPSTVEMLAAQLSALVIAIYVIEAVIDSAGDSH
jgi:hypothetical protein